MVIFNQQAFIGLAVVVIILFGLLIKMFGGSKKGEPAKRRCFGFFEGPAEDLTLNFSASSEDNDQSFFQNISGMKNSPNNSQPFKPEKPKLKKDKSSEKSQPQVQSIHKNMHLCDNFNYNHDQILVGHNVNGTFEKFLLTEDSQAQPKAKKTDLKKHNFAEQSSDDEVPNSAANLKLKQSQFGIMKENYKVQNTLSGSGGTGEKLSSEDNDELQKLLKYEADSDEEKAFKIRQKPKFRAC